MTHLEVSSFNNHTKPIEPFITCIIVLTLLTNGNRIISPNLLKHEKSDIENNNLWTTAYFYATLLRLQLLLIEIYQQQTIDYLHHFCPDGVHIYYSCFHLSLFSFHSHIPLSHNFFMGICFAVWVSFLMSSRSLIVLKPKHQVVTKQSLEYEHKALNVNTKPWMWTHSWSTTLSTQSLECEHKALTVNT